jgi:hypothetical protein
MDEQETLDYEEVEQFEDGDEIILPEGAEGDYEEYEYEDEDEVAGNPALQELYDILPKSLHGMVQPIVDKWQSGIDQQFERIAPYRKFADSGLDPQIIEASLELASEISTNPRAVYDELATRYGWKEAENMMATALQVASGNTQAQEEEDPYFSFEEEEEPGSAELDALRAEIESLRAEREEEKVEANEAEYEYQIETSIEVLKEDFGDFDEEIVIRRAMLLAEEYPSAELPQLIGAAFEQYQEEVERIKATIPRAPRVAGGNGNGIPAPAPVKLETRDDRVAAIEAIIKNFQG